MGESGLLVHIYRGYVDILLNQKLKMSDIAIITISNNYVTAVDNLSWDVFKHLQCLGTESHLIFQIYVSLING